VGVSGAAKFERELPQGSGNGLEATLTRVREASRSRASDSPCQARAGARTAWPDGEVIAAFVLVAFVGWRVGMFR
jgi:hypothetical protein